MRLKTFHAEDMQSAMQLVREALGDNAVILSTKRVPDGRGVAVTVAQEEEEEAPAPTSSHAAAHKTAPPPDYKEHKATGIPDYFLRDIERILRGNGTHDLLVDRLLADIRYMHRPKDDSKDSVRMVLTEALGRYVRCEPLPYLKEGSRLIFIGAPGAGKTLTAAKMAARIVKQGGTARVLTTDHKRAGGAEQLSALAEVLGIELSVVESRKDLKTALGECDKSMPVLIDTAGVNPYEFQELKEVADFAGLMELTPVLVFAAGGDPSESAEVAQAFSFLGVEHMIVTRLDLTHRYGSVLTAADAAGVGIAHATGTPKVLGDFDDVTPDWLAGLMMRYGE